MGPHETRAKQPARWKSATYVLSPPLKATMERVKSTTQVDLLQLGCLLTQAGLTSGTNASRLSANSEGLVAF
jgi:hypothetical protein